MMAKPKTIEREKRGADSGAAHGSVRASDPLKPSVGVLIKLGSAIVHIEEMKSYHFAPSEHAYTFDMAALSQTLDDPEVKEWLTQMSKLGFMPVKRDAEKRVGELEAACRIALWIRDRLQERGSFGAGFEEWQDIERALPPNDPGERQRADDAGRG